MGRSLFSIKQSYWIPETLESTIFSGRSVLSTSNTLMLYPRETCAYFQDHFHVQYSTNIMCIVFNSLVPSVLPSVQALLKLNSLLDVHHRSHRPLILSSLSLSTLPTNFQMPLLQQASLRKSLSLSLHPTLLPEQTISRLRFKGMVLPITEQRDTYKLSVFHLIPHHLFLTVRLLLSVTVNDSSANSSLLANVFIDVLLNGTHFPKGAYV